jgi:hypothetical protein
MSLTAVGNRQNRIVWFAKPEGPVSLLRVGASGSLFDSCANTTNVRMYLEAFPVLRKVPSGPDPITSDPLPPPATNVRTFDLAIVREALLVNQAH